jgi:hypothetical protein
MASTSNGANGAIFKFHNVNGGQGPSDINGQKLAKALKAGAIPPDWRARLALRLQDGSTFLHHLTAKQARQVTGARVGDLAAARRAERPNDNGTDNLRRVLFRNNPTDSDVDVIVAQVGTERLMDALDRATKPPQQWAALSFPTEDIK